MRLIVNDVNLLPTAEMLSGFMLHEIVAWSQSQIFHSYQFASLILLFHIYVRNSQHLQRVLKKKKRQSRKGIIDNVVFSNNIILRYLWIG